MSPNLRLRCLSALAPFALLGACTVESAEGGGIAGVGNSGSVIPTAQGGSAGQGAGGSPSSPVAGSSPGVSGGNLAVGGTPTETGGAASASAGTAGATSMAGSGGTGAGGTGASGGANVHQATAGCMKQSLDEPGKDVLHNIMVKGVARRYWTKLPTGYTGSKPTPLVFYGPGCGASGVEGAPLDNSIKNDAIRVFVIGTGGCFDTAGPEPETGYFNAVLDEVQANYCTDTGRVFVSGYSSGAWLSDLLACTAGDRITAIGTAAGGFKPNHPPCKGNPAAMFHAGTQDGANPITKIVDGVNQGSSAARDRMLKDNGCSQETKVWDAMYPYCQEYIGCKSPVIWCQQDVGHSNGEEVARTGWWKFWSSLP